MVDTQQYIAQEYLYNNRIYKGRFPIALVNKNCPYGGYISPEQFERNFTPNTTLREELNEDEIGYIMLETEITEKDSSGTTVVKSYITTENSSNQNLSNKNFTLNLG